MKKHTSLCTGFQRASFPDSPYKALLTQLGSSTAFYLTGSIVHLFIYYSQELLLRAFEFSSFLSLLKCWPIVPAGNENTRMWSNCSEGQWQGGLAWCVRAFAVGGFHLWAKCWHAASNTHHPPTPDSMSLVVVPLWTVLPPILLCVLKSQLGGPRMPTSVHSQYRRPDACLLLLSWVALDKCPVSLEKWRGYVSVCKFPFSLHFCLSFNKRCWSRRWRSLLRSVAADCLRMTSLKALCSENGAI